MTATRPDRWTFVLTVRSASAPALSDVLLPEDGLTRQAGNRVIHECVTPSAVLLRATWHSACRSLEAAMASLAAVDESLK